jgi:hypothetical protein
MGPEGQDEPWASAGAASPTAAMPPSAALRPSVRIWSSSLPAIIAAARRV